MFVCLFVKDMSESAAWKWAPRPSSTSPRASRRCLCSFSNRVVILTWRVWTRQMHAMEVLLPFWTPSPGFSRRSGTVVWLWSSAGILPSTQSVQRDRLEVQERLQCSLDPMPPSSSTKVAPNPLESTWLNSLLTIRLYWEKKQWEHRTWRTHTTFISLICRASTRLWTADCRSSATWAPWIGATNSFAAKTRIVRTAERDWTASITFASTLRTANWCKKVLLACASTTLWCTWEKRRPQGDTRSCYRFGSFVFSFIY